MKERPKQISAAWEVFFDDKNVLQLLTWGSSLLNWLFSGLALFGRCDRAFAFT
ncbi:hypothetical protein H6G04_33955 [Calothrix membranacea FACHB-236]|nr:hypothetical protein [Calothrix membranacea FACHB-236]